uniref:(northern house mosquito) hypothetical protein n=1 Tax=Culex pipiens TaxID=7175 RepID=A0A8D8KTS1_CULPI
MRPPPTPAPPPMVPAITVCRRRPSPIGSAGCPTRRWRAMCRSGCRRTIHLRSTTWRPTSTYRPARRNPFLVQPPATVSWTSSAKTNCFRRTRKPSTGTRSIANGTRNWRDATVSWKRTTARLARSWWRHRTKRCGELANSASSARWSSKPKPT